MNQSWRNLLQSMKSNFASLVLAVAIAILLSLLPIYPLWVEGRQFTQSGESLYHEWQFGSLNEYYESHIYAQTAWQGTTKVVYYVLAVVNPVIAIFISWFITRSGTKLVSHGNRNN